MSPKFPLPTPRLWETGQRILKMPATLSALVTQELPLSQIKPNPNNPRRVITPEMIDNMAASLNSVGLKNPIKVIALPDGTDSTGSPQAYELISGHIRLAGATQLGWETIPATVLSLTPEQALLEAILDNRGMPMNWLEQYEAMESLLKANPDMTQQAVAQQLGVSQQLVSQAFKTLKHLTPEARQTVYHTMVKTEGGYQMTANVAFNLSTLEDPQKIESALKVAIDKKMTIADAKKLVASVKTSNHQETSIPPKTSTITRKEPTQPKPAASTSVPSAHQASMGAAETLAWDTAAGISVITQIKAKIKKGERPSFFEALLLTGHTLWKVAEWLCKHAYRIGKPLVKLVWKMFKESLRSALKVFGPTVYRITSALLGIAFLGVCAWVAWDSYAHGFHPRHSLSTLFILVIGMIKG